MQSFRVQAGLPVVGHNILACSRARYQAADQYKQTRGYCTYILAEYESKARMVTVQARSERKRILPLEIRIGWFGHA